MTFQARRLPPALADEHPLAVIERVGLVPGEAEWLGPGPGLCRVSLAGFPSDQGSSASSPPAARWRGDWRAGGLLVEPEGF